MRTVFALIVFACLFFLPSFASATWWNSSWSYRETILINGSTSNITDGYQTQIYINSSRVGANFNWTALGNHTRFSWLNTSSGAEQEIPFWIESWYNVSGAGNATIWVKVPNVTVSTVANTTIYMYYGNPSATYNNSLGGNNTFVFFDDGSSDKSGYTTTGSTKSISGGEIKIYKTAASAWNNMVAYTSQTFARPFVVDFDGYVSGYYTTNFMVGMANTTASTSDPGVVILHDETNSGQTYTREISTTRDTAAWINGKIHYKSIFGSTGYTTYYNNNLRYTSTTWNADNLRLYVNIYQTLQTLSLDNIRIGKYASPEPVVLSYGAQETSMPFVQIILPLNATYNSTARTLNYTATSSALSAAWFEYDGANTTLSGNTTFTALNNQTSKLTLYANDSSGNINSTSVTFTVDTVLPQITLNLPSAGAANLPQNLTFNFTASDNLAANMSCSIYIDSILNQTNLSAANNTLTNFNVNGISEGLHFWNVSCADSGLNTNFSSTRNFTVNVTPILTSASASPSPIKGGSVITITASGIDDPNNNTLNLYCSESSATPNSTNTACTGGTTTDTTPPYALTCSYAASADDASHTATCRVFDGAYYSTAKNATFTTDSSPPSTSVNNAAGDPDSTYYDTANDGVTNITVDGEAGMACRYSTSDLAYSGMSNDCAVAGTQAVCSPTTANQGLDAYNFYVSCKDSLENGQNSSQNLDIISLVHDWTAPTTTDNSSSDIQVPSYAVNITEQDNLFGSGSIETKYCTDTVGNCTPNTAIDSAGTISFTSSNRGTNFLRYYSVDFNTTTNTPGNTQSTQNKTITINRLPVFTSASDNATTVRGGAAILISTGSSDADSGQTLKLFVCNSTSVSSEGCAHTTYCSNTTGSANSSCSFAAESDDAAHTWFAFLYDSLNESAAVNKSGSYTTDSTRPQLTVTYPENKTYSQSEVPTAIITSEASGWAGYSLDGAANVTMNSISSTIWSKTISSVPDGFHNITFYANDSVGNMNVSAALAFTVNTTAPDTAPPSLTILSPSNGSYLSNSAVLFNISLDENGNWTGVSINNTANLTAGNNTNLKSWNLTASLPDGRHNATIFANDSSGNTGNSSVIFFAVDTHAPQNSSRGFEPASANDTADVKCFSFWTDSIELSRGYVEDNATGAPRNSSVITMSGTSGSINATIPASDTSTGILQCRIYAFDKANNSNTLAFTISISDGTNPVLENISYAPTSADALDPNVAVNVTANVSDNAAMSAVLLQYKLANASDFQNASMNLLYGNRYNGSFIPDVAGNWSFRIFANDTSGNQNISAATNLTVEFDRTWSKSTTIPSTKTIVKDQSRIIPLGNITITNTADEDLNFSVSSPQSFITFNGTSSSLLVIVNRSGNATTFNVTANTSGFSVGDYNYTLTVSAYTINPTLISSQNITGMAVIQNVPGPYLSVSIDAYDASVSQGQTNITLTASVSNLGSDDATDTWLAWTLPGDWSLSSGTLNKSLGFIGIGQSASNSITVSVGSSAATGSASITASSNSTKGGYDYSAKTVSVTSPTAAASTTAAAATASGGGGSSGPSISAPILTNEQKERLFQTEETFELVRGREQNFILRVENPLDGVLENVSVSISGFLSQYLKVAPPTAQIPINKSANFTIWIEAPKYFTKGKYGLNFTITGTVNKSKIISNISVRSITSMRESRLVSLIIYEVAREDAEKYLNESARLAGEMENAGLKSDEIARMVSQMESGFAGKNYEDVKSVYESLRDKKESAFAAMGLLDEVQKKIDEASRSGIEAPTASRLAMLAKFALQRGDYETALKRAEDAKMTFALETVGKFNVAAFVTGNWPMISVAAILTIIISYFSFLALRLKFISKRLASLKKEENILLGLIRQVQNECFKEGKLSMEEYMESLLQYEKKISAVIQETIRLETARANIVNILKSEGERLLEERKKLLDLIKKTQDIYMKSGKLETRVYENRIKSYAERMTEIEETLANIGARKAMKRPYFIKNPGAKTGASK